MDTFLRRESTKADPQKQTEEEKAQPALPEKKVPFAKIRALWNKYGWVFVFTYGGVYIGTLGMLYVAVSNGMIDAVAIFDWIKSHGFGSHLEGIDPRAAHLSVAWILTKVTEPARALVTAVVTPALAKALGRVPKDESLKDSRNVTASSEHTPAQPGSPTSDFEVVKWPEDMQTIVVRMTVPAAQAQQEIQKATEEIRKAVRESLIVALGPCFVHHLQPPGDVWDIEVGVTVNQKITNTGRVKNSMRPSSRIARALHSGPLERLPESWAAFADWAKQQKLPLVGDAYEEYLIFPPPQLPNRPPKPFNPADYRVSLILPLRN